MAQKTGQRTLTQGVKREAIVSAKQLPAKNNNANSFSQKNLNVSKGNLNQTNKIEEEQKMDFLEQHA